MIPRPQPHFSKPFAMAPTQRPPLTSMAPPEPLVSVGTDIGRKRPGNEDHHGVWAASDPTTRRRLGTLLVVADGMGGAQSGEVASQMAVETVMRVVSQSDGEDIPDTLRRAFQEANRVVHEASLASPERNGMGTTCTAVLIRDGTAWVSHVGDTRAYLIRSGQIRQLTEDHTLVARLVELRELTRQGARRDPRRNVVTRCMGPEAEFEPDVFRADVPLRAGDAILLCSDGLHGYFNDSELADLITDGDRESVVRELIAEANDRGGADNITVMIAFLA